MPKVHEIRSQPPQESFEGGPPSNGRTIFDKGAYRFDALCLKQIVRRELHVASF